MVEKYVEQVHNDIVLDIGDDIGALIIYTDKDLHARQIDVSLRGSKTSRRVHTDVLERRSGGRQVFAAVFASLPEGDYVTWSDPAETFTIVGGHITELDWRHSAIYVPPVSSATGEGRGTPSGTRTATVSSLENILPPRYQGGKQVSSAPMGSAPIQYADDGRVAWNEMWTGFCDLALAGGPPHRDTLLEPVPADEVRANMEAYRRALTEIERGLRLTTGLPIVQSERLGWIGLQCDSDEMALWLLRAIIVENVCVRREGTILFLPVGPAFRIEYEIKNVITVVAKTHHYWIEHRDGTENW
ncbi:MAG: hypothetical protein PVS3B3_34460 [Ktedonobacteraceae bacterium]